MGKYHKTREQKIATAAKYQEQGFHYSLPQGLVTTKIVAASPVSYGKTYDYVKKDVQKTLFVSSVLILSQMLLFFLLQQHIVKIPGLYY